MAPDGSQATYAYQGNQTTVTDPAGKWKQFTSDAFGNLTTVTEPNPAGGNNLTTSYVYTLRNQLAQATMVRDGYTQTRTFLYSGPDLVSATNPENGTVTYAYNGVHQVTTRTDAKGQVTQYAYDSYGRLLSQRYFLPLGGDLVEDTSQAVTYTYDSNPYGGDNVLGRLGVVNFGQSRYDYSYNTAGRVTQQNLQTQISFPDANWNTVSYPTSLTASYGWDDEGRMTSTQSPAGTYNYSFDAMGRLGGMTDGNSNLVASATYGLTGQVSSFWMSNGTTDTRTYNSLMQMTRQTAVVQPWGWGSLTVMDMEYRYTAGQNNGRIAQSKDWVTGDELNYTYDSLQRVTGVATTGSGGWGTTYGYDGFGNLWNKTPTKGSTPPLSVSYDETTNRQYGVNYDANGNPTTVNGTGVAWDGENRLAYQDGYWGLPYWYWQGHGLPVPPAEWEYDPFGKRVQSPGANGAVRVSLYNLAGQVLYQMDCPTEQYNSGCVPVQSFQYFGSKLLKTTDRLGSVRVTQDTTWPYAWQEPSYYPYGEENANPLPDGTIKYATYLRDGPGLDYAMNRYYSSALGRFYTPDPAGMAAANPKNPGSWNRYAYGKGDPVNHRDPTGLDDDYAYESGWNISYFWSDELDVDFSSGMFLFYDGWIEGQYDSAYAGCYYGWDGSLAFWMNPGCPSSLPGTDTGGEEEETQPGCNNWGCMPAAEAQALLDLGNPACAGVFSGHDPATVLRDIIDGTGYGDVAFSLQSKTIGAVTQLQYHTAGHWWHRTTTKSVTIDINSYVDASGIYWNTGNAAYNAVTLIHELGHAFEWLFGAASTKIVYDANPDGSPNGAAEAANAKTLKGCGP